MAFTRSPIPAVVTDATGNTINLGAASGAFTSAPTSVVLTDSVGNTLNVGPGVVAKASLLNLQADIGLTTIYTVPATNAGWYRLNAFLVITQAATTSSTLPGLYISFIDNDTGSLVQRGFCASQTVNGRGTDNYAGGPQFSIFVTPQPGSVIQIYTNTTYASVGATPLQYAVHYALEFIG